MAIVINQDEQDLIQVYQIHLQTESKLNLLIKVIGENHKHNFLSKLIRKLFKKRCLICEAYRRVTNG